VKQFQRRRWGGVALVAATVAAVLGTTVAGANAASGGREQGAADGVLRLGAEEELACADWISSCAGSSWGNWTLGIQTLPQAYRVTPAGEYVPGPILTGEPTVEAGPPVKISYRIKPEAVWSDGAPITSKDFEYLWKQVVTSKNVWDATGSPYWKVFRGEE